MLAPCTEYNIKVVTRKRIIFQLCSSAQNLKVRARIIDRMGKIREKLGVLYPLDIYDQFNGGSVEPTTSLKFDEERNQITLIKQSQDVLLNE